MIHFDACPVDMNQSMFIKLSSDVIILDVKAPMNWHDRGWERNAESGRITIFLAKMNLGLKLGSDIWERICIAAFLITDPIQILDKFNKTMSTLHSVLR